MKQVQNYQQNFAKGEIDPQLWDSANLQGYYDGLSRAENIWVTATGSAQKRYGMVAVAEFLGEMAAKMFPFTNTRGDRFLFIALPGKIEVYRGDSGDQAGTLDFAELTAAAIPDLCTAAYGDSLILPGETLNPTQIKWLSGNDFSIGQIVFTDVPSYEFSVNDEDPDGGMFFFQPNSTGISEFRYYLERGSYEAYAFSKFGGHLLHDPCAATLWKGDRDFATNIFFYVNGGGSMVAGTVKLAERIMAFTRVSSTNPFVDVCVCGQEIYVLQRNGDGLLLRRFARGIYTDANVPYASALSTMPINAPQSPYAFDSATNVAVVVYMSDTRNLFVNGNPVYTGPPYTGEIRHFMASGWMSKGAITLSDGAGTNYWAVNNIGRSSLSGGAFQ
ncbi:MAG: hypothetical protein LBI34_01165 [Puniceicoccales bacterium]|jgi:hypothetical protein|nr:hypothetical protein [Puniceicoccales bacterium]